MFEKRSVADEHSSSWKNQSIIQDDLSEAE